MIVSHCTRGWDDTSNILCRLFYANFIKRLQNSLHECDKCNKHIAVFSFDTCPSPQIAFNIFVDISEISRWANMFISLLSRAFGINKLRNLHVISRTWFLRYEKWTESSRWKETKLRKRKILGDKKIFIT